MTCVMCEMGSTKRGTATFTAEREGRMVVFRNVPADVCENCGESYFDGDTVDRLQRVFEDELANGAEFALRDFKRLVAP